MKPKTRKSTKQQETKAEDTKQKLITSMLMKKMETQEEQEIAS